jgi:hypothetical protein
MKIEADPNAGAWEQGGDGSWCTPIFKANPARTELLTMAPGDVWGHYMDCPKGARSTCTVWDANGDKSKTWRVECRR